jgi:Helix-turn-helix domain
MQRIPLENKAEKAQPVTPPLERQTYTIEEAAKILGICRAVAYRRGVLPTVKIAGRRLVPKVALDRMLAETA